MNIDDLVKVYARALEQQRNRKRGNSSGTANEGTASGIAAVVKALRDEIVIVFRRKYFDTQEIDTFLAAHVVGMFEEILGTAESEKAATNGGGSSATLAPEAKPEVAADPSVCVWKQHYEHGKFNWLLSCNSFQIPRQSWMDGAGKCNHCNRPIRFEAKP